MSRSKYIQGDVIKSVDVALAQEFIFWNGKVYHNGWFASWQSRMLNSFVKAGKIRYAIRSEPVKSKPCRFCFNATVDPRLNSDNDLSYVGIGLTAPRTSMHIRSGSGRPTEIVVSRWNEEHQKNFDVGYYEMKFCPECGRRLIENKRWNANGTE